MTLNARLEISGAQALHHFFFFFFFFFLVWFGLALGVDSVLIMCRFFRFGLACHQPFIEWEGNFGETAA
jgi:hypothetical protein